MRSDYVCRRSGHQANCGNSARVMIAENAGGILASFIKLFFAIAANG